MSETFEIEELEERVVLVGVSQQDGDDAEDSLEELKELVKTANAQVVGTLIQRREGIHPGFYVGTGKVEEIRELVEQTNATGIVCDDELSPAQLKNLTDAFIKLFHCHCITLTIRDICNRLIIVLYITFTITNIFFTIGICNICGINYNSLELLLDCRILKFDEQLLEFTPRIDGLNHCTSNSRIALLESKE